MTTTEEALGEYLVLRHIIEPGSPPEDWYRGGWFYFYTRGRRIPIFPMLGFRRGLAQHDVDHMLSGYDTTNLGEAEIGAWEVAAGTGPHWIALLLDLAAIPVGLASAPRRVLRAFARGRRCATLYRESFDEALLSDSVGAVRRRLRLDVPSTTPSLADALAFAGLCAAAGLVFLSFAVLAPLYLALAALFALGERTPE